MERRLERILTICLGSFWLLDGILQLQPAMFTSTFVSTVLTPNLQSQPPIIASIVALGIQLWNFHRAWSNSISASIQLLIAALLLFPLHENARRFGLWLSAGWALIIWVFGEGFGNLATGSATFYTGAPGAALLYILLAFFLLYPRKLPLQKLPIVAGILFLVVAALNFAPMFWQPTIIGNLLAIAILVGLGILLLLVPSRPVAWVTITFLIIVWWFGQNFGGILAFPNGTGTDPNSALLFVLLLIPIFFKKREATQSSVAASA